MKAECHDTFVSNCLELCAIMSPPLSECLKACVYTVYTGKISPILFTRGVRRRVSQDVLTLCPVINFIDLNILPLSSTLALFLCKNKNIKY